MNPTAAQSLDPKLKEVYDRVMGTPTSAPASPASQPPKHVPVEGVVTTQSTPVQQASSASAEASAPTHEPEMVSINTSAASPTAKHAEGQRKISPVIFIVVGIGILVAYTVVWLKVFGIF